jgi:hypothetical protein
MTDISPSGFKQLVALGAESSGGAGGGKDDSVLRRHRRGAVSKLAALRGAGAGAGAVGAVGAAVGAAAGSPSKYLCGSRPKSFSLLRL